MDMVVNHMVGIDGNSGVGSGGSSFNTAALDFPGVPFSSSDFNCCQNNGGTGNCADGANCYTTDCGISDYSNAQEVGSFSCLRLINSYFVSNGIFVQTFLAKTINA